MIYFFWEIESEVVQRFDKFYFCLQHHKLTICVLYALCWRIGTALPSILWPWFRPGHYKFGPRFGFCCGGKSYYRRKSLERRGISRRVEWYSRYAAGLTISCFVLDMLSRFRGAFVGGGKCVAMKSWFYYWLANLSEPKPEPELVIIILPFLLLAPFHFFLFIHSWQGQSFAPDAADKSLGLPCPSRTLLYQHLPWAPHHAHHAPWAWSLW